jgi:hypothetical protein
MTVIELLMLGGFNVVSQTQMVIQMNQQPFKGLVFSEIMEIIMMLLL